MRQSLFPLLILCTVALLGATGGCAKPDDAASQRQHQIDLSREWSPSELDALVGQRITVIGKASFVWASNLAFLRGPNATIFLRGLRYEWPEGLAHDQLVQATGVLAKWKLFRDPVLDFDGLPLSNGSFDDDYILNHPRWFPVDRSTVLKPKLYTLSQEPLRENLEPMVGHKVALEGRPYEEPGYGKYVRLSGSDVFVERPNRWPEAGSEANVRVTGLLEERPRGAGASKFVIVSPAVEFFP